MTRKQYAGDPAYESYSYLEAGRDYEAFELAQQVDRVPSSRVPVSEEQEARVDRLVEEHLVCSLHDHLFVLPEDLADFPMFRRQGRDWTGYQGLRVSGLDVVFDALMNGTASITSRAGGKWDDVLFDLGMRLCDIAHQEMVVVAGSLAEIAAAKRNRQVAWVPGLESAAPIENELDRLDLLYGFGIRHCGIAYSEANTLGSGLRESRDGGLTRFGRDAVRRMNQLGIAIDVSHSGDVTGLEAVEASEKPVFVTHSGARALWPTKRMKPDELLRACAERGGVIGVIGAPHSALTETSRRQTLESTMEHLEYMIDLVGIEHVAFGADTLFGDHVALHRAISAQLSLDALHNPDASFDPVEYVDGVENPGEQFMNFTRWLVAHDYSDEEIGLLLGGNVIRALEEIW